MVMTDIEDSNYYNLPNAQGHKEGGQEVLPPLHNRPEQRLQGAGQGISSSTQK